MKLSELKEIIKTAMLKEVDELEIDEAKKDEKEADIEVDTETDPEMDTETDPEMDTETDPEMDMGGGDMGGDTSEVLNHLESALEAAKATGDEKLMNQIGNTITFYTRQHVVKEEELFEVKRMKVLAGILK